MSHHITLDIAYKIGEAQRQFNFSIDKRVTDEMNYISDAFRNGIHSQLENIIKNPFNAYIQIPVKDNCSDLDLSLQKIFLKKLSEQYSRMFQHTIQITDGSYYILLQSPHFTCDDVRPRPVQKLNVDSSNSSFVFSDSEKKRYEKELDLASPAASLLDIPPRLIIDKNNKIVPSDSFAGSSAARPTPRLGFASHELRSDSEKKNLPTSLLLQRRPSRMSLPSFSARGKPETSYTAPEGSITD
jgi:hypothetical protein